MLGDIIILKQLLIMVVFINKVEQKYLDSKYNSDTIHVYTPQQQPVEGKINVKIDTNNKSSGGKLDPNIHIENSNKIRNKKEITAVLNVVMKSPEFDPIIFTRSKESYVSEWIGHNRMYTLAGLIGKDSWRDSAEHVDLNNLENRMIIWDVLSSVTWG